MSLFNHLPAWMLESVWLVPAIGLLACGMAFFVGWQLMRPRRRSEEQDVPLDFEFLKGVTRERRGAPRRKGNTLELQITLGEDGKEIKGWVIDRSQGGLRLLVEEAVPEMTLLRVRPRATGDQLPWTDVMVRSCRAEGYQFELSCQFQRPPNYNLLLKFG
jgi:hypothetical protein